MSFGSLSVIERAAGRIEDRVFGGGDDDSSVASSISCASSCASASSCVDTYLWLKGDPEAWKVYLWLQVSLLSYSTMPWCWTRSMHVPARPVCLCMSLVT